MNAYNCDSRILNFTPTDEHWEGVNISECCPECNKKMARRVLYPLLSDEHSKTWFSIFYKSKYLLMVPVFIIITSAFPGVWAIYSLPQGYWLTKIIALVVWAPAFFLFMAYLRKINVMRLSFSLPFTLLILFLSFSIGKHDLRVMSLASSIMQSSITANEVVGNGHDAHGCISSAGYSWCDKTSKNERPWELTKEKSYTLTDNSFIEFCKK